MHIVQGGVASVSPSSVFKSTIRRIQIRHWTHSVMFRFLRNVRSYSHYGHIHIKRNESPHIRNFPLNLD
jgi:hypothetical protein